MAALRLTLKLSWRSFVRHRRRSLITASAISLSLALMLVSFGTMNDSHARFIEQGIRMGAGHVVVQGRGYQRRQTLDHLVHRPQEVLRQARRLKHVDLAVPRVRASGLIAAADQSAPVLLAGVVPRLERRASLLSDQRSRVAGHYLRGPAQMPYRNMPADVFIGKQLAKTLGVELGDRVVVTVSPHGGDRPRAAAFRVRGVFRTGVSELDGFYAEVPLASAQSLLALGQQVTQVALLLDDEEHTAEVTAALRRGLAHSGLEILPWQVVLEELNDALAFDTGGAYVFVAIILLIVGLGIFNTMLMSVIERTRELGVMMALGTSGWRLFNFVLVESMILALVAAAIGVGLGLGLHSWVAATGIDISALTGGQSYELAGIAMEGRIYSELSVAEVLRWIGVVIGIVLLSAVYPAWRATRLSPVDAMRHV